MRHISPRWIYIMLGVLLLAVSDYVSSALPLIAGVLLLAYGIYGEHYYNQDGEG